MTLTQNGARQPLRLWPGVVAVILQWLLWLLVRNDREMVAFRLALAGS